MNTQPLLTVSQMRELCARLQRACQNMADELGDMREAIDQSPDAAREVITDPQLAERLMDGMAKVATTFVDLSALGSPSLGLNGRANGSRAVH